MYIYNRQSRIKNKKLSQSKEKLNNIEYLYLKPELR